MDFQEKISARLRGDTTMLARRSELLTRFLGSLENGGVDEALSVLSRPFGELEDTFAAKLAELEQLL